MSNLHYTGVLLRVSNSTSEGFCRIVAKGYSGLGGSRDLGSR